jgi:hypothetical protein
MRKGQRVDVRQVHPVAGAALLATSGGGGMAVNRPHQYRPRDWAVKLLQLAAQVEHSLMVQYLFAAYSLVPGKPVPAGTAGASTDDWTEWIVQIAREEMGHLLTVQNLLRLTGGPPCWEREDFPVASDFYPFPFALERLSKDTLAKYLYTEMTPDDLPAGVITPAEKADITTRAERAAGVPLGGFLNHVGTLYNTLVELFGQQLADADLFPVRADYQSADFGPLTNSDTITLMGSIKVFEAVTTVNTLTALQVVARQGEGADPQSSQQSHFERFLQLYRQCPDDTAALSYPVLTNPGTAVGTPPASAINDDKAKAAGVLFNLRYRVLLTFLAHFTALPDVAAAQPVRLLLRKWALQEMHGLRALAQALAALPSGTGASNTGAPFEMPYTLALSEFGPERWRLHLDLLLESQAVVAVLAPKLGPGDAALSAALQGVTARDGATPALGRWKDIATHQNDPQ